MKRKFLVLTCTMFFASNIFAASSGIGSLAKSLNSLDTTKAEKAVVEVNNGINDIFPLLVELSKSNLPVPDEKGISYKLSITNSNFIANSYTVRTKYIYKFGIGIQCKDVEFNVSFIDNAISVDTINAYSYNVDKSGNSTGDKIQEPMKVRNQFAKDFSNILKGCIEKLNEENYKEIVKNTYNNLDYQLSAGLLAPNKLKAKKWYEAHSIIGEEISLTFDFYSLSESKNPDYAYELAGMKDLTIIKVFSNNDNYIDFKEGTRVTTKGIVSKVKYSEDYESSYKIKAIEIFEN